MARKFGKIGSFVSLWQKHESLYVSVFLEALTALRITNAQRNDEDAISEALCPVLRQVCFQNKTDVALPRWEDPIQPSTAKELTGGKKQKIPDFTCALINPFAKSAEMYEIPFHVECKRLGSRTGSWNLNKNYVTNGVCRFGTRTHEYGKRAVSGMMIGYIINMDRETILLDVNSHLLRQGFSTLFFDDQEESVTCEQRMNRNQVKPAEFKLIHLWADLR